MELFHLIYNVLSHDDKNKFSVGSYYTGNPAVAAFTVCTAAYWEQHSLNHI